MPLSRTFVGLQINVEWISEPSVMYLARWCQKTSGSLRRLVRDVEITQSRISKIQKGLELLDSSS